MLDHAITTTSQALAMHGRSFRQHVGWAVQRLVEMRRIARERHALEALDDHLLKDIGLSRSVAQRETSRPWFDVPGSRFGGQDR